MPVKKLAVAPALLCFALSAFAADEAVSPPVGGMTITVLAGSQIAPLTTSFSLPLLDTPVAAGNMRGTITSVTATTLSSSGAGWTNGGFVIAGFPYAIRITSGQAAGFTATISSNTADTITATSVDFGARGVLPGDAFSIIPVDTLLSLFGTDTLLGGTSAASADIVTISSSAQFSYYFNTSLGYWVSTSGPTLNRNNVQVPINSVVSITRKSAELKLTLLGRVPDSRVMVAVGNSGSTYFNSGFPTDVTLGTLAMQTRISGWRSSTNPSDADLLAVNTGSNWFTFFHNGTNWQQTSGPAINRNSQNIPAGAAIRVFRPGVTSGISYFTRDLPYTL